MVFPDVPVGAALNVQHALPGDVGVVVDGDHVGAHVEAGVVAVIGAAQHAGDDMLAGVLLHVVESPGPVDAAGDGLSHGEGPVAGVIDDAVLFVDIQHLRLTQGAVIGALSAALGIEGGAVEDQLPLLLVGGAVQHRGLKLAEKGILIV